MEPINLNPMNNKKPTKAEIDFLLKQIKEAIENGRNFFIMAEMRDNAMGAGSGRKDLIPFVVSCMMANKGTADLILNAAINYVRTKVQDELCKDCPGKKDCEKLEEICDEAKVDTSLKKELDLLQSLMKPGKN